MNGSIFLDSEGNEVEIISWGDNYIHYVYRNSSLERFTSKKMFLKEFEPKEDE